MNDLQTRVNELAKQHSKKEFLELVNNSFGLVESQEKEYLIGTNEYSVCFGQVVKNPVFETTRTGRRARS